MIFRKSIEKDLKKIMEIVNGAKELLKENEVDQWQSGYPNEEVILEDIEKGYSYVLEDKGVILGTTALSFDREKTYDEIYDGEWVSSGKYGVIHRIAVNRNIKIKGIGTEIIKRSEEICFDKGIKNIKIDTHEDNITMKKLLEKNNFKYCGVIYLEGNIKRIALEKVLQKNYKGEKMKKIFFYNSPIGKLGIVENGNGITEIYTEKELQDKEELIKDKNYILEETELILKAHNELEEYFKGERKEFTISLSPEGTEFQKKVWEELMKIPYGETKSYKDIAIKIGKPTAARAVGMANNKNKMLIVIPCHRVIGQNGSLVGYASGVDMKKYLLELEKNHKSD
jgi:O-6-methylguanine DNA methyltransferase